MLASLYLFLLQALLCSSEMEEKQGKQSCDPGWDIWNVPSAATVPKRDKLYRVGPTVYHGSTMGCWNISVLKESFCFTFRQNEVLWREVVSLRQNHSQQQKVINKVVIV